MSELFPELDRELVRYILRDGVRIEQEDPASKEIVDFLCRLKIVTIREHQYVRCAYRDDYDFLDRRDLNCTGRVEISGSQEDCYCPECGQPIGDVGRKKRFIEWEVLLNPDGIEAFLSEALQTLEAVKTVEKIGSAAFRIRMQSGMPLKVVVPKYAEIQDQSAGLFFAEPTLYVVVSPIDDPVKTVLEETQYIGLSEILSETVDVLEERISVAATPIHGRRNLSDVEARFDGMLERHRNRRWQFFEHNFIPAFVQHVTEHPELSHQYLSRLKRLRQTVFGNYYIPIGGSGVTDLRGIDKYELMTELFEGEFIGDAKCYVDSTLEYDKLTSVNAHLDTDPTNPRRAVVFVAGNDISSTSWDFMIRLRDRWGYWRLAIIPKYLLLEMISELNAVHLLDT